MKDKFKATATFWFGVLIGFIPPVVAAFGGVVSPDAIDALAAAGNDLFGAVWGFADQWHATVGAALILWDRFKDALTPK